MSADTEGAVRNQRERFPRDARLNGPSCLLTAQGENSGRSRSRTKGGAMTVWNRIESLCSWACMIVMSALCVASCTGETNNEQPSGEEQNGSEEVQYGSSRVTRSVQSVNLDWVDNEDEFARFAVENFRKINNYDGLATQADLSKQVLFQLYRTDKARMAREAYKREKSLPAKAGETNGDYSFVPGRRSFRRKAYRTPFFEELKNDPLVAISDIGEALVRSRVSREERVELLRLLHAIVRQVNESEIKTKAKDLFLQYSLRTFPPSVKDYTPYLSFAYYARLETDASVRIANGERFAQAEHADIPPNVARRMFRKTIPNPSSPSRGAR